MQRLEDWFPNASGWLHVVNNILYFNGNQVSGTLSTGIKGWQKIVVSGNNYVYLFGNSGIDLYNVGSSTLTPAAASLTGSVTYRPSVNI